MENETSKVKPSVRSVVLKSAWLVGGCAVISLGFVPASHAQLGIDTAAILAGLQAINSTMQSVMQAPMQSLQQTQSDMSQYEQNVMYPLGDIQKAQSLAGQSLSITRQMEGFVHAPISSATIPGNIQFETAMLSGDPNQISTINNYYQQVFGSLPTATQANANMVAIADMDDATAMECMKRAIQLDALAEQEMAVSQTMLGQLQSTAPGNAALVSAQASAWLLQGSGYTQSAMAQMLRGSAAGAAMSGFNLKVNAASGQNSIGGLSNLNTATPQITGGVTP